MKINRASDIKFLSYCLLWLKYLFINEIASSFIFIDYWFVALFFS